MIKAHSKVGEVVHGKCNTRIYHTYKHMKQRCYNKNCKDFKDYGGRGITICDEWLNDFMAFYNLAYENGYKDTLTIDRIDNNKGYEPSNCRWISNQEQQNNKRNNVLLTYNGKTQTMAQWVECLGLKSGTVRMRHHRGWSDKECLFGKEV